MMTITPGAWRLAPKENQSAALLVDDDEAKLDHAGKPVVKQEDASC